MKLVRKKHFFFKKYNRRANYRLAKLYFKRSYTNIFVTLTDLHDNVIKCHSAGSCVTSNSKRKKTTPQALEAIMKELVRYIYLYRINDVVIILRVRVNIFVRFLIKELKFHNVGIARIISRRKKAHNGMRGRKLRRK